MNLGLQVIGPSVQPMNYVAWLAISFGVLCFCETMGAGKPLNRAGLVLFAAAFCAETAAILTPDPLMAARAHLLYAFSVLGALTLWSVALMHRQGGARRAGIAGASVGFGALALLVGAHVLVGTVSVFGFTALFSALTGPGSSTAPALAIINALLAVWAVGVAGLMQTDKLSA